MAEAVVSLVVERIADYLIQEAGLLRGQARYQDERVCNWVSEIRDVAYDAEDVIDTFILEASAREGKGVISGFIESFTSTVTKGYHHRKIRKQIRSILNKIGSISASTKTYEIKFVDPKEGSSSNSALQRRLRGSYPYKEEEHVIRFDTITTQLIAQLKEEVDRLCVVSIAGMGGLGKTTLARILYNDTHVRQHFDCHAWAFISQHFSFRDILLTIMKDVASIKDMSNIVNMEDKKKEIYSTDSSKMKQDVGRDLYRRFISLLGTMGEQELVVKLYQVLEEKLYLVVLDDIWNKEAWNCLKNAFPNGKKGSKVLFTTRNRDVAIHADPWSTPMEPPLLTAEESWKLLSRKAFPREAEMKHGHRLEFEKIGMDMAKRCGGLPLALVVLGGLLAPKKTVKEWQAVHRNIVAQLTKLEQNNQYGGVYGILAISYQALPFHLKQCFLHLSQYPEDWEFYKRSVIRLWIAEGFVQKPSVVIGEETIEDVAEQYLDELVSRSMVQVRKSDYTGTGIKIFQMHDLMRDMCISKAREECFAAVTEPEVKSSTNCPSQSVMSTAGLARRIAFHPRTSGDHDDGLFCTPLVKCGKSNVRSILFFVENNKFRKSQQIYIHENFKLLRVLNIRGIKLVNHSIHRSIGNLIHLRYLGLRYTGLRKKLPASIGNLKNLYTLDLRENAGLSLPNKSWEFKSLRHLLLDHDFIMLIPLENLETLKMVRAENLIRKNSMMKLSDIRNLGISFQNRQEVEVVLRSPLFGSDSHLRSLKMIMDTICEHAFPSLRSLSSCQHLTKLVLRGTSEFEWILEALPKSLIKLVLNGSQLRKDPMGALEKLPNLRFLSLEQHSYKGYKMVCSAKGFPQLEILRLAYLEQVEEWEIEEGAMPCLNTLHVDDLRNLKLIPEGLKFLTTLREFNLPRLSYELKKRVEIGGEDFHKIQHIPSISFTRI